MKLLHWSCQGLGNPLTIQCQDIRKSSKPDIMFLIETKSGYKKVENLSKELSYAHFFVLPADGLSGGLAIFWDASVQLSFVSPPSLNCSDMYILDGAKTFCLSYLWPPC